MPSVPESDRHSRGGLFRRFILPQVLIAVAAGTLALVWATAQQRQLDHQRMARVAAANAAFLEQVNLPRSRQMADNLSVITGAKVGFFLPGEGLVVGKDWSGDDRAAAMAAKSHEPDVTVAHGLRALVRPIDDGRGSIVVIEPAGPLLRFSESAWVLPFVGMTVLAIAAAFLIARSVVRPLQQLATTVFSSPSEKEMPLPQGLTARQDEIGLLARTLARDRSALLDEQERRRESEKMALLGQLATSLAHEIKNPAAAIIMHARALEEQGRLPEGTLIRQDGEHITSLVNQWLFVAKPQAPRTSETDIATLLRALSAKLEPLLDFHQCRLDLQLPESAIVRCDAQRLEQVFRNLIDNAVKAMPTGGTITLRLGQADDGKVEFTVADQGGGFSDEALTHFGETFYSEREGGIGLGLALATGVIDAHGGALSARNLPDGGACVTGTLPPVSS